MYVIEMILVLMAYHFVCDYVFQGDAIALGKNKLIDPCRFGVNWWYWMSAHAATHAIAVSIATGNVGIGCMEFVLHFVIDWGKCEKLYNLHVDQLLHLLCKIFWVIICTQQL